LALLAASACSAPESPGQINDPYERFNRAVHESGKVTDRLLIRPASQVYGNTVPKPVRRSLSNAANNLNGPRTVANDLLQGNIEDAGHNLSRFLVNTTIGVFGLFDPASGSFGLENRETGFADTLAVWGVREGAYLELPLFGPSTERDAVGLAIDIATNPIGAVLNQGEDIAAATSVPSVLNSRFELTETIDSILYDSADSYAQLRLFYLESRRFALSGQTSAENVYDPYENLYDEVYKGIYDEF
jgi:phospholipid-binding lipoprotein MlaA